MVTVEERLAIENEIKKEIRAKQREYKKEWRAKNKDKIKKHNENYINRKVAAILEEKYGIYDHE